LAIPFITLLGEVKASKIFSEDSKFFFETKQTRNFQYTPKFVEDEFNQNFDTEQLSRIIKLSGLSNTMQVFPKDDLPLKFKSNIGTLGSISVFVKSKKQIEEEQFSEET